MGFVLLALGGCIFSEPGDPEESSFFIELGTSEVDTDDFAVDELQTVIGPNDFPGISRQFWTELEDGSWAITPFTRGLDLAWEVDPLPDQYCTKDEITIEVVETREVIALLAAGTCFEYLGRQAFEPIG